MTEARLTTDQIRLVRNVMTGTFADDRDGALFPWWKCKITVSRHWGGNVHLMVVVWLVPISLRFMVWLKLVLLSAISGMVGDLHKAMLVARWFYLLYNGSLFLFSLDTILGVHTSALKIKWTSRNMAIGVHHIKFLCWMTYYFLMFQKLPNVMVCQVTRRNSSFVYCFLATGPSSLARLLWP